MNLRSAVLLCALFASIGAPVAHGGIVVHYWQSRLPGKGWFQEYGAPDRSPVPDATFNGGTRIGLGNSDTIVQQLSNVSTATRTFDTIITGDGTDTLTWHSNNRAYLQGKDYSDNGNRQSDGDIDLWYTYFVVTQTGEYDLSATFSSRTVAVTPGSSPSGPGYAYYGAGGSITLVDHYFSGFSGNFADAPGNSNLYSVSTRLKLQANNTYIMYVFNYQYAGFGGPVTADYNTGWDVTLRAVPEPTSLAIAATGGLLFLGMRRRRR